MHDSSRIHFPANQNQRRPHWSTDVTVLSSSPSGGREDTTVCRAESLRFLVAFDVDLAAVIELDDASYQSPCHGRVLRV